MEKYTSMTRPITCDTQQVMLLPPPVLLPHLKGNIMPTPGELLARRLCGDSLITDKDIEKSSEECMKKNV